MKWPGILKLPPSLKTGFLAPQQRQGKVRMCIYQNDYYKGIYQKWYVRTEMARALHKLAPFAFRCLHIEHSIALSTLGCSHMRSY